MKPDWMYDLYSESLRRASLKQADQAHTTKPVEERDWCPLRLQFKDDPYLWWLEDRGLL